MRENRFSIGSRGTLLTILVVTVLATSTYAATEKVLHAFNGIGREGSEPLAGLVHDAAGNLYGTTLYGGTFANGTVFELSPKAGGGWTEKVLYSFDAHGALPYTGGLILDATGNLYGTTYLGGAYGSGTVFELSPRAGGRWTEKVLHNFNANGKDGYSPWGGLIFDTAGDLYGTTLSGGAYRSGTVFELAPKAGGGWTEDVLHDFDDNGNDGSNPFAGLIFDAAGNLYGTTGGGGSRTFGTVFELTPKAGGGWTETILHSFNGEDGNDPYAGVIFDAFGNLYGTTGGGGAYTFGTVFELSPKAGGGWSEKVLHNFGNTGKDGNDPSGGVLLDAAGNLYGTTYSGGAYGLGTVFELTPKPAGGWTEKILHTFNGKNGAASDAGLIFDTSGNLYGTTREGGPHGDGIVFEIIP
jgi:uncharacterized repeat protein (TIGR03803 family)